MEQLKHDKWVGTTYGNGFMHRWLIRMLRVIDVRILYAFAFVFVVPPTLVVNGKARKSTYAFYRHILGFGTLKSVWMTYKNFCAFTQVVIDRFAMYAGRKFQVEIDGYDKFLNLAGGQEGFVQLSSHIGNYELAGYTLVARDKRFNALVFGGEKESVMANRRSMFDGNNIRMIPMMPDMSHLFVINEALSDGEIISMPADRVYGSQKHYLINFLGRPAKFPQGPFLLAAMRDTPVLYVTVMKTGVVKYRITVECLKQASVSAPTKVKAQQLAAEFVSLFQSTVRKHPAQWYNYFDFWTND